MSLDPGSRLGHYVVGAPLGTGGMGEVYRATGMKLGRDVALKVLPADLAGDTERLARFQREARAVAALNHPHIVTIYSVEDADGVHFFTMELVRTFARSANPGAGAFRRSSAADRHGNRRRARGRARERPSSIAT